MSVSWVAAGLLTHRLKDMRKIFLVFSRECSLYKRTMSSSRLRMITCRQSPCRLNTLARSNGNGNGNGQKDRRPEFFIKPAFSRQDVSEAAIIILIINQVADGTPAGASSARQDRARKKSRFLFVHEGFVPCRRHPPRTVCTSGTGYLDSRPCILHAAGPT